MAYNTIYSKGLFDNEFSLTQPTSPTKIRDILSFKDRFKIKLPNKDFSPPGSKFKAIQGPSDNSIPQNSAGQSQAIQTGLGAVGALGAAGVGGAAVLAPMAIAAFAIMAFSQISAAKKQKKAIKKAIEREKGVFETKRALFINREQLENIVLTDTLNQVERQATKNRSTLTVAKGENLAGATYNALQTALRRNELETKERVKDKNVQKRIAMREQLTVDYHSTRVRIESIAEQVPSNSDIALGIIGSGMQSAMSYYGAIADPTV